MRRTRYIAPARDDVDRSVFTRAPLTHWRDYRDWMEGARWPSIDDLNARWPNEVSERFAPQTRALLDDGLHYEERIAQHGLIATREANWHDLFNAMIWLRYPDLKRALNRQQVAEVARVGPRERSRPQCAQTHFDEAGSVVVLRDPALLALWDAHDWHGLFWRHRDAWLNGAVTVALFGHALLEHALTPGKLLVGKAIVVLSRDSVDDDSAIRCCAQAIAEERLLRDPLELRPLPLSGIPGWHVDNGEESFHLSAPCYQPLRSGRSYPAPLHLS
ncbi:DUF3025 domain-containing protein [Dyella psychrodurans]|uniref:DUF3025 domain-containing protein n=1 Tax=Dyella psychrodurans TaxID=1927960 RepID=A0A370XC04_9GAMM|nr:DUF3025 domain-containing protein [Dyella psychrodurans]RDS85735.1 DUF3025 domain-containing protein [Dyella psychrodurans]